MATFVFDVSRDAKNFIRFIKDLRNTVRDVNNPILVDGVARLTAMVNNPETFDLNLRSGDNVVTLRVRTDNLYVIGFSNRENRWFEFRHDNNRAPMIQGSTFLPYNGSYTPSGIGSLNEEQNILGRTAVADAINGLANFNGTSDSRTAAQLRVLIVNFIESTRFDDITDRVDLQMSNPSQQVSDLRLTSRDIRLIHSWGALSQALRNRVNNPDGPNPYHRFDDLGIRNNRDAAAVLGMVLIGFLTNKMQRQRRSVSDVNSSDTYTEGLTLVEVVGVLINNIDGENPGDLYGTISITDGFGTVKLFDRGQNDPQSVGPGGWVDLTWPSIAIFGTDDFVIYVNLMDYDVVTSNDEVARGQVVWNSRDALSSEYDRIQKKQVKGQYGSVEVHFAVLTDAVKATVEVVMLDGDGENVPDVYGKITASTNMAYSGERLDYKLFDKERGQSTGVPIGSAIQLQRNVVSAPLCSVFQVSADLWDADRFPDMSPDDHIANGSVTFTPRLDGKYNADIRGQYGSVRVYVTWSI